MDLVITIDGPSGVGKSTVSRRLASHLGYDYIDSGALYRIVALEVIQQQVDQNSEDKLFQLCEDLNFNFLNEKGELKILCRGQDISDLVRLPKISMLASSLSSKKVIREQMTALQRKMGQKGRVVLEGRDAGTVVFPQAPVKFYLNASVEERGRRRYKELREKRLNLTLEQVTLDIIKRDQNDSSRSLAPLLAAEDAVIIDSTAMTFEEVIARMMEIIQSKINEGVQFNGSK